MRSEDAFVSGRLAEPDHVDFWEQEILPGGQFDPARSELVKSWLRGVHLPDLMQPFEGAYHGKEYSSPLPVRFYQKSSVPASRDDAAFADAEIAKMLRVGAIEQLVEPELVTLPVFVTRNALGKPRFILDARYTNLWHRHIEMKYQSLLDFTRGLGMGALMFKVDFKSAYYHVRLTEDSRRYLGFEFRGVHYRYATLPFGYAAACAVFNTLSDAMAAYFRRLLLNTISFIDDYGFSVRAALERLQQFFAVWKVCAAMYLAGWTLAKDKCLLMPTTRMPLLGFVLDSVLQRFDVPEQKLANILVLLADAQGKKSMTKALLQSMVGKVQALSLAVPCVSMFLAASYRNLAIAEATHAFKVAISQEMADDYSDLQRLREWTRAAPWISEATVGLRMDEYQLDTDASGAGARGAGGWGAVVYRPDGTAEAVAGAFDASLAAIPIHFKEALAVPLALEALGEGVRDCRLKICTDNELVRFTLLKGHKGYGVMRSIARCLWGWQMAYNVHIRVERVSTTDNLVADTASRTGESAPRHPSDLRLNGYLFSQLARFYDVPFTLDVCASALNAKLPRYLVEEFSEPSLAAGCVGRNVFMHSFRPTDAGPEFLYCFAPKALLSPLWRHFRDRQASGVMILPDDPSAPWYGAVMAEAKSVRELAPAGTYGVFSQGLRHLPERPCATLAVEFGPREALSHAISAVRKKRGRKH